MNSPSPFSRIEPVAESVSGKERAKAAGEELFGGGAIASLHGEPRPILIGDLQWLDGSELVLFTAYGEGPADVHLVAFDEAIVNDAGSVTFLFEGHVVGSIHRIEDADVDDTDDYRIAWQLWQDVAPVHQPMIQRSYQMMEQFRGTW